MLDFLPLSTYHGSNDGIWCLWNDKIIDLDQAKILTYLAIWLDESSRARRVASAPPKLCPVIYTCHLGIFSASSSSLQWNNEIFCEYKVWDSYLMELFMHLNAEAFKFCEYKVLKCGAFPAIVLWDKPKFLVDNENMLWKVEMNFPGSYYITNTYWYPTAYLIRAMILFLTES
jgi:hypothetical protein